MLFISLRNINFFSSFLFSFFFSREQTCLMDSVYLIYVTREKMVFNIYVYRGYREGGRGNEKKLQTHFGMTARIRGRLDSFGESNTLHSRLPIYGVKNFSFRLSWFNNKQTLPPPYLMPRYQHMNTGKKKAKAPFMINCGEFFT